MSDIRKENWSKGSQLEFELQMLEYHSSKTATFNSQKCDFLRYWWKCKGGQENTQQIFAGEPWN
jgi:hypothetical protein